MRNLFLAVGFLVLSNTASAQTTVPNTFTAGSPAKAAEVNANFQALVTAINSLGARVDSVSTRVDSVTARVGKLEGTLTATDVAGTYALYGLQTDVIPSAVSGMNEGQMEAISYSGTAILTATSTLGGTLTLSTTESTNALRWLFEPFGGGNTPTGAPLGKLTLNRTFTGTPGSTPGTWTFAADGTLTLSTGGTWSGVAGGRLFVTSISRSSDGSNVLLVLVRKN